jgi:hypothetical protein
MKLFANGCSFTWGGGLYELQYYDGKFLEWGHPNPINQERLSRVWPAQLANKLKADQCVNLSIGSGSNDRIVRTTMDFFAQNHSKDWLAIIQWSVPNRFEYWEEESNGWTLVSPQGGFLEKNADGRLSKQVNKFKDEVYKNYTDYTYAQKYWTQVVGLASFFTANNIKYYFINLTGLHEYKLLQPYQQQYLENNINWISNGPTHIMPEIFTSKLDSSHPTELGHVQIAEYFYQELRHTSEQT